MSDVGMSDEEMADIESDEARPVAADNAILKILSGVQSGVEVALSAGHYTLGSDDGDDIQIIDVSLASAHLELRIAPGANQIRASNGQVRSDNGLALEPGSDWQEVEPLDVVHAGTTRFAIAPSSAAWTSVTDISPEVTPAVERPAASGPAQLLEWLRRAEWAGQPASRLMVPAVALFGIIILALWYLAPGGATRVGEGLSGPAAFAEVRSVLSALPFARDIELRQEVDGVIYGTGHVETPAERRAVAAAIEATGVPVTLRVWVLQSMHHEIAGLIETQAQNVTVEISGAGVVTLRGLISNDAQAERFITLVREVPGVSDVRSELRTPSSLLADVEQVAQSSQIKPWVLFRLDRGVIEATGALPAEEVNSWADFLQIYARRFARDIGLRSFVQLQDVNVQSANALPSKGAITIGAQQFNDGDVEIDVSRLQGGEVALSELLVGGRAGSAAGEPSSARAPGQGAASPVDRQSALAPNRHTTNPRVTNPFAMSEQAPVPESFFPWTLMPSLTEDAGDPSGAVDLPSMMPPVSPVPAAVPAVISLSRMPESSAAPVGTRTLAGAQEAGLLPSGGGLPAFVEGSPQALPFREVDGGLAASRITAAPASTSISLPPAGGERLVGTGRLVGAQDAGLMPDGDALVTGENKALPSASPTGRSARPAAGLWPLATPPLAVNSAKPVAIDVTWFAPRETVSTFPAMEPVPRSAAAVLLVDGTFAPVGVGELRISPPAYAHVGASGSATRSAAGASPLSLPASPASTSSAPMASGLVSSAPASLGAISEETASTASLTPDRSQVTSTASQGTNSSPALVSGSASTPPTMSANASRQGSLADSTRLLLEQWRDGRLQHGTNANPLMAALESLSREGRGPASSGLSRLARQQMHDRYLPASGVVVDRSQTCWPGSRLTPQDVATSLFWLDILSLGDALSLARFDVANRMMLIEVALSPRRAADCIASHFPQADIVDQSVYLREMRRNPAFIRFVMRDIPPFSLDVTGVSTAGEPRFVQTRSGVKVKEGAYPDNVSRLLVVGEQGAAFETASGVNGLIYGPGLNWLLD